MTTKKLTQRRWHKIPGPLQDLIKHLAIAYPDWSPKQILDQMQQGAPQDDGSRRVYWEVEEYDLPEIRTVERIVKDSRPADPTDTWLPTAWSGEDAGLVLESLTTTEKRMGLRNAGWPTIREAERILWLRKAAPTLPAIAARMVAAYYLSHEDEPDKRQMLDWMVAYRIWESEASWREYRRMVDIKQIPGPDTKDARVYHSIAPAYVASYVKESEKKGEAK